MRQRLSGDDDDGGDNSVARGTSSMTAPNNNCTEDMFGNSYTRYTGNTRRNTSHKGSTRSDTPDNPNLCPLLQFRPKSERQNAPEPSVIPFPPMQLTEPFSFFLPSCCYLSLVTQRAEPCSAIGFAGRSVECAPIVESYGEACVVPARDHITICCDRQVVKGRSRQNRPCNYSTISRMARWPWRAAELASSARIA